jgi:predicted metal-dependent hydrolase
MGVTVARRATGPTLVEGERLFVSARSSAVSAKVAAFLKETARAACVVSARTYAARVGREIGNVTMRDPRGRWGSCSGRGDLMFSWRLILAPADVLEYVVAHEVAHLVELNHSPRFWRVVQDIYGGCEHQRAWLRAHGRELMLYDFSADDAVAA